MRTVVEWVRGWELWRLPPRARPYVLAVVTVAAGLTAHGVAFTPFRVHDGAVFLVFIVCGLLSIEALRRTGSPFASQSRPNKDLLSAWTLPIVFLVPPIYALLAPIPLHLLSEARSDHRRPWVKRVFNMAAVGVSGYAAAVVYRAAYPSPAGSVASALAESPRAFGAMVLAAAVCASLNRAVIVGVLRSVSSATSWRKLLLEREATVIAVGEQGMGIVVAVCWSVQPFLLFAVLPPILLLQRTLVHAALQEAARTDAKTQLANPVYWREVAGRELLRAGRSGYSLAILLVDIDHFKRVNDEHGHLFGDQVLTSIAGTIHGSVRPRDLVGRFGGEEFVILQPGVDRELAEQTGERVRARVEELSPPTPLDADPPRLTVSVGAAAVNGGPPDLDVLLAEADAALYAAKAAGRNRVCVSGTRLADPSTPSYQPET
ncbi:MAG: GGDEF domain-containing protein [Nocardioidaceae bacterium]